MKVGVAGGGLVGRLLAWRAARAGAEVELFDCGAATRCSPAGAGMLCPTSELVTASPNLERLGSDSMALWRDWLDLLGAPNLCHQHGSVLVAHQRDLAEMDRVASHVAAKFDEQDAVVVPLDQDGVAVLEPDLGHLPRGYLFPQEGCIEVDAVLQLLHESARSEGVAWYGGATVNAVHPGGLEIGGKRLDYDWACDCRGLGSDLPRLRPVRGEIIHLQTDEVTLRRPVRIASARQPAYIVPNSDGRLLVGATEIESGDRSGVSVRSALELMGAAYSILPALAEARITDLRVGLRPALPDNEPTLDSEKGRLGINGMYRHGYLASPALVEQAVGIMGLQ